jgi:hypothetical protein
MTATIRPSEALKRRPDFFSESNKANRWILRVVTPEGKTEEFVGADWEVSSRFGRITSEVVVDKKGDPQFDRPAVHETPCVNVVAWGRDLRTGEVKVALISEERPHVNHPELPDSTEPLRFAQIPMGFMDRILGKDGTRCLEWGVHAAGREVMEETGIQSVRGFTKPNCPYHNYSPSFMATWAAVVFVEVDLETIGRLQLDHHEVIYKAEYVSVRELLARIREGQDAEGNIFRGSSSLSALMMFFAQYPEFWPK